MQRSAPRAAWCSATSVDVIKIEPTQRRPDAQAQGFGLGCFPYLNRNKRSLVVNAKSAEGQAIIHGLLQSADVVIENFWARHDGTAWPGYEQLQERYPRLVYCALKGFFARPVRTAHGPRRSRPDDVRAGLRLTGRPGDRIACRGIDHRLDDRRLWGIRRRIMLQQRERSGKGNWCARRCLRRRRSSWAITWRMPLARPNLCRRCRPESARGPSTTSLQTSDDGASLSA